MEHDFLHTRLGRTNLNVHRLGISATYRPGVRTLQRAYDCGLNLFFGFGIDTQMTRFLRDAGSTVRDNIVLATGGYNYIWGYQNLQKSLESRLKQFGTDRIDLFLFLGVMKEKEFPLKAREELTQLKESGKVRFVGMSCHDRKFAGRMAEDGLLDVLMVRYNAAHPGAEVDIFPHLQSHDPGVVSYTATRWTYLLRRPRGWPKDGRVPTPGECYRFVLSHPSVHVCLTAPRNLRQFDEDFSALSDGPMAADDLTFMRAFGSAVHERKHWFMGN